jgi:hypothetical protein
MDWSKLLDGSRVAAAESTKEPIWLERLDSLYQSDSFVGVSQDTVPRCKVCNVGCAILYPGMATA